MYIFVPVILTTVLSWPVLWPELATNDPPAQASSGAAVPDTPTADIPKAGESTRQSGGERTPLKTSPAPSAAEVKVEALVVPVPDPLVVAASQKPWSASVSGKYGCPGGKCPTNAAPATERYAAPGPNYEAREYPGSPTGWGWFLKSSREGKKPGRWEQQRRCNSGSCSLQWIWRGE